MTTSAYLQGYGQGVGHPLDDFQRWLVARGTTRPELAWPWLVLAELYPVDSLPDPMELTSDESAAAIEILFDLLEAYLDSVATG